MNKCIKLQIQLNDDNIDIKELYKELWDIQYKTRTACNFAMNLQYNDLMRKQIEKLENGEFKKDKSLYGKSFMTWMYDKMSEYMNGISSANVAQTRAFVMSKANFNPVDILKGEKTLTTFKQDIPIFIHNGSYKIWINDNKEYNVETTLFNREKQKELNVKRINFKFVNPDGNCKATLDKMMNGEYKQGAGQIIWNKRKKKWMFIISFSFEPRLKELDEHKIMGVDLGIVNVATMSVYNENNNNYERMNWKEQKIDGAELIKYRQKTEARRKELSIASKWASENKIGHGYKQRMSDANKVGDKYERFRDTYNHKVSRYIVNLAEKYECGIIQMENLSGFSEQQTESLLKNWSYYDLQSKVQYKAEEKGIKFILIDPRYTSKRCSRCGCIHNDNRDCKTNQSKFKCVECGYEENADINASKNIAIRDIDEIIKNKLNQVNTQTCL